ncbi:MAG: M23 family metallopeptidase [Bacteroidota bacterium]
MKRDRQYLVVTDSGTKVSEIRFFRAKLISSVAGFSLVLVLCLFGVNYMLGDPLGIGYSRVAALRTENIRLRGEVEDLSSRIASVEQSLRDVSRRGNELRLLVDLKQVDEQTASASAGGAILTPSVSLFPSEVSDALGSARQLITRLTREVRLQRESYEEVSRRYEYNKGLFAAIPAIKPMEGYYALNGFGMRLHPVLRVYRLHEGVDVINDVGTPVYAAGDGTVRFAGRTMGGYGIVVDVAHGYGYSSLYAHLSRVFVRNGQKVRRGELIARSGRSGLVSGPHLHYEIRLNGRKLNPVDFFFDDVHAARYRARLAALDPGAR